MNSVLISFISFTTSIVKRVCVYILTWNSATWQRLSSSVCGWFLRGKTIAQYVFVYYLFVIDWYCD